MGTGATGDPPTDLPGISVGEVAVPPLLRGHEQTNDSTILRAPKKGHFQEYAFGSKPEIVRERRGQTIAVVHDSGGE